MIVARLNPPVLPTNADIVWTFPGLVKIVQKPLHHWLWRHASLG
jgi:hypothetical protein